MVSCIWCLAYCVLHGYALGGWSISSNTQAASHVLNSYARVKFYMGVRGKFRMSAKVTECARAARLVSITLLELRNTQYIGIRSPST